MISSSNHQLWNSPCRVSQSLCNDRCQTILNKAVFEHFKELKWIAALLLASKSFQNSSFGANFLVNFVVDEDSILLVEQNCAEKRITTLEAANRVVLKAPPRCNDETFLKLIAETKDLDKVTHLHLGGEAEKNSRYYITVKAFNLIALMFPKLVELDMQMGENVSDAALEHISALSDVTSLNLTGCIYITDAGLQHVSKIPHIKFLDLTSCINITGAGLEHISKCTRITSLNLSGCRMIADGGLEHISKLSRVVTLNLRGCNKITDAGLEHLSDLSNITSLNLSRCDKITDAGIEHISKITGNTSLDLTGCKKITVDAKKKLTTILPNCSIIE